MEFSQYSEPPTSTTPEEGVGFIVRAVAKTLDLILHNLIGVGLGLLVGIGIGVLTASAGQAVPEVNDEDLTIRLISGVMATIGFIFYNAICEAYYGATLGKLLLGIHVVNRKGEQISFGSAFVRALVFFIDQFFFGIVAYLSMKGSALQQRLGDKWAGTVVVKRSEVQSSEIPSGCMFILVLLIGLLFDGILQVLPIVFFMMN